MIHRHFQYIANFFAIEYACGMFCEKSSKIKPLVDSDRRYKGRTSKTRPLADNRYNKDDSIVNITREVVLPSVLESYPS